MHSRCNDCGDTVAMMVKLDEMERKSQELKKETSLVLRHIKVRQCITLL